MKTTLLCALACAGLAVGQASAAPLDGTVVTATYNGLASGMLGTDSIFASIAGSNITHLDGTPEADLFTSDFLFGIDISSSGLVSIFNNDVVPAGSYTMNFDFSGLTSTPIAAFSSVDTSAITGTPLLTVVNGHDVTVNLSSVSWNSVFSSYTAQLSFASAVPEPAAAAMLLAGLGVLALRRRKVA